MDTSNLGARIRRAYTEADSKRLKTIFLAKPPDFDEAPKQATQRKTMVGRCAATNLNGTQCNCKAASGSGGFCKRHAPTKEMLAQL